MIKMPASYDFLTWTSFPSSLRVDVPAQYKIDHLITELMRITPKTDISMEANFKWKNNDHFPLVAIFWYDATGVEVGSTVLIHPLWQGPRITDLEWTKITNVVRPTIPENAVIGKVVYRTGYSDKPGVIANCWLDDLKVYQDGTLIYANDFGNWNPIIGAGVGGAGGALAGYLITKKPVYALAGIPTAVIGGVIGWLTAKP